MKMLRVGLLALFVACVAWPVAATASPRSGQRVGAASANSTTFTDPTGDSGNAPDITTTTVSNDENGQLTWSATMPNRPVLTDQDGVTLYLDTNGNLSDNRLGAEYIVFFNKGTALLLEAFGSSGAVLPASWYSASYANGVATFSVNMSKIGNPTQINFRTLTSGDRGATFLESAPDSGWWNYQILISSAGGGGPNGPTGPGGTPPVKLAETKAVVKGAVAGKTVTVSAVVTNNGTGVRVASVTCAAKVAGKSLRGARFGRTASGKISCSWHLPSSVHGRSLTGKIGATYQGKSVSKPFATKIK